MATTVVQVRGARQLRSSLKKAGKDLQDLKDAHAKVAAVVAAAAAARAPKRTGRLATSVRGTGTTTAAVIRAGFKSVPYAGPIHWGWPARGIAAQPFLSDAATSTEGAWLPIYEGAVETALDQVKGI
jgi:hypothetical protein